MQMIMGEQQQLQSLVHELKWSYVALWSFNSQTRNLEWRAGHWRQSDTQGWNEQYFNSTFKSCQFGTRFGSVGLAFAERRKLWMNGSKVVDNAGSKELVDFQNLDCDYHSMVRWRAGAWNFRKCAKELKPGGRNRTLLLEQNRADTYYYAATDAGRTRLLLLESLELLPVL